MENREEVTDDDCTGSDGGPDRRSEEGTSLGFRCRELGCREETNTGGETGAKITSFLHLTTKARKRVWPLQDTVGLLRSYQFFLSFPYAISPPEKNV